MSQINRRIPISIVCVSNNSRVLNDCLLRSIDTHRRTAPKTEIIVVENSKQEFSTAGAALNQGTSLAKNDVCVFVHQDVYLHSLIKLEEAAAALVAQPEIGLIGANGITAHGELFGRMRDRFVLTGRAAVGLAEVDSVDEMLFMSLRQQLIETPLSEDPDLAWHAYAVEYGARMRRLGKRIVVGHIPITHNSLTTNLDRLSEAHRRVGALYPEQLPITTTCGIINGVPEKQARFLAKHRWRYRWLRDTRQAHRGRRSVGKIPVVLSDIRMDADNLLENCGERRLTVVAIESTRNHDDDFAEEIELERLSCTFTYRVEKPVELVDRLSGDGRAESLLLTNLDREFLTTLRGLHHDVDALLGFAESIGFWLILGPAAKASTDSWRLPSAKPLGLRPRR